MCIYVNIMINSILMVDITNNWSWSWLLLQFIRHNDPSNIMIQTPYHDYCHPLPYHYHTYHITSVIVAIGWLVVTSFIWYSLIFGSVSHSYDPKYVCMVRSIVEWVVHWLIQSSDAMYSGRIPSDSMPSLPSAGRSEANDIDSAAVCLRPGTPIIPSPSPSPYIAHPS